jgi:hypothetical protein
MIDFYTQILLTKKIAFNENQHSAVLHVAPLYVLYFLASSPLLYFLLSHSTWNMCTSQLLILVKNTTVYVIPTVMLEVCHKKAKVKLSL